MIRNLRLRDVGPAGSVELNFGPRFNALTGANGSGKSMVLSAVWWALTGTWSPTTVFPSWSVVMRESDHGGQPEPRVGWSTDLKPLIAVGVREHQWDWRAQEWSAPERAEDTLAVYARGDGGWAAMLPYEEEILSLTHDELWYGKWVQQPNTRDMRCVIPGLIEDLNTWERKSGRELALFSMLLRTLSPPGTPMLLAGPVRVFLRDRKDVPALRSLSQNTVAPATMTSSGVRRAASLAYLLTWAWTEHCRVADASCRKLVKEAVVLVDDPELHQHPDWQREFLPAVARALEAMVPRVQVLAATKSPQVLASVEEQFDRSEDTLHVLTAQGASAPCRRLGDDAPGWATSDVFGIAYARSRATEEALMEATAALDDPNLSDDAARKVHQELLVNLGRSHPFWARWMQLAQARGVFQDGGHQKTEGTPKKKTRKAKLGGKD